MTPRIMVVDDYEINRQVLEWGLEELADVHAFDNGIDALAQIEAIAPDIIFLDLMMPDMDGYGVMARMQTDCPAYLSRTIVITADMDPNARGACMAYGIRGFIQKPIDLDAIKELVVSAKAA